MSVLSSADRYVLMGREVTVEIRVGKFGSVYRNGYALGYEVGAPGRVLVAWTQSRGDVFEASWIWPDQVLQTTGDHLMQKLKQHDYTGADQAAFERIYHEALTVADEPDPVAVPEQAFNRELVPAWGPSYGALKFAGAVLLVIFAIFAAAMIYPGW